MVELLPLGLTLLILFALLALFRGRRDDTPEPLLLASVRHRSRQLGSHALLGDDTLGGEIGGVPLRYRMALRGRGGGAMRWTEVEVELPRGHVSLHLRPRADQPPPADALRLDEPSFDHLFVLEAAPADVVRRLLTSSDEDGRSLASRLVGLGPVWIVPLESGFRVAVQGWQDRPARVEELCAIALVLATKIADAVRGADRGAAIAGSPYRPEIDASALARLHAERARDVARLDASERRQLRQLWLVFGVALLAVVSLPVLLAL